MLGDSALQLVLLGARLVAAGPEVLLLVAVQDDEAFGAASRPSGKVPGPLKKGL